MSRCKLFSFLFIFQLLPRVVNCQFPNADSLKNFTPVPKLNFENILPSRDYAYWEYGNSQGGGRYNTKYRHGVICADDTLECWKKYNSFVPPQHGFGLGCLPGYCFSYIFVFDGWNYCYLVSNSVEMKKFLGTIDNIDEALLYLQTTRFSVINGPVFPTDLEGTADPSDSLVVNRILMTDTGFYITAISMENACMPILFNKNYIFIDKYTGEVRLLNKSLFASYDGCI